MDKRNHCGPIMRNSVSNRRSINRGGGKRRNIRYSRRWRIRTQCIIRVVKTALAVNAELTKTAQQPRSRRCNRICQRKAESGCRRHLIVNGREIAGEIELFTSLEAGLKPRTQVDPESPQRYRSADIAREQLGRCETVVPACCQKVEVAR